MIEPHVTIKQGSLRGSIATDATGNAFYKFQGIPYAKPPVGDLRFKVPLFIFSTFFDDVFQAPLPPEKWSGIFDATKHGEVCYSRDPLNNGTISGSEDCLFLNVYTKNLDKNQLRPVLFWIHGGVFEFGSGNENVYGPEFLMTEDVVLVTINYRLGILGFISFDDPSLGVPGNAGLKDQVMALKWVQNNISHFGGDSNNVTIFGESAGGASVNLLMLSPLGRGLFHKAIAQSGSALNPWVEGTPGTELIATAMNLEGANEKTIYDTLIKKSVQEVYDIQEKIGNRGLDVRRAFGVVIEKNSKEAFLDKKPIDILNSGNYNHVPLLIGVNSSEGMIYTFEKVVVEKTIPWFFGYQHDSPEIQAVAKKIKNFYFNGEDYSEKWINKKYDIFSDTQFLYGIYVTVISRLQHSASPTYLYRMSIETELNFFKKLFNITVPGVCHCDDVAYLFKNADTSDLESGSMEEISVKRFVKLWTNFAKSGNPTPPNDEFLKVVWQPVTNSNLDFLDIDQELKIMTNFYSERMNFWKNVFEASPAGQKLEELR